LNTRYANAVELNVDVGEEKNWMWLPPLTLQAIVENAIMQNAFSRTSPLTLSITFEDGDLVVKNTIQRKMGLDKPDAESGLDNLVEKYRLMHASPIVIREHGSERTIRVPLIVKEEKLEV
jgi:LytS/YehU family sensor histidine kinase